MINDIAATVLVKTLLHSLWQGAIILLLVLCVNYFLHNKAKIKYWTSIVALYLLLIINLATFYFLSFTPAASAELYSTANYNFII